MTAKKFETSTLNPLNKRFFSLNVTATDDALTVTDQLGNTRHVVKTPDLYNLIGREYWVKSASNVNANQIYNASDLVVHQIDGALYYDAAQKTSWQAEIDKLKE